jgi:pyruvate ferredoxin oxidoreductase gamma subunit
VLEIRIHGRGGQGAVVASNLLAAALFAEGWEVQSFPTFGVERRGAPVAAYVRADRNPIYLRCQIRNPDHLVVLDSSLLAMLDLTSDLKPGGWVVVNTSLPPEDLALPDFRVATVDAARIALSWGLGSPGAPIVNTAILGAFAKATGLVRLESVLQVLRAEFGGPELRKNLGAVEEAAREVKFWPEEASPRVGASGRRRS